MLFNSLEFFVFLPIVFAIYWGINRNYHVARNLVLLFASYFFYGWWDWRFLGLIFFSSILDFAIAKKISQSNSKSNRKLLLILSFTVNLGFLAFFKYYDFFIDNFSEAFRFFGYEISPSRLSVILPVGISFYTFQTLSYTIDVYRNKLKPTNDLIAFFSFVSFFPQLVAGPIERAQNLLPQFYYGHVFDYHKSVDGLRQMLWGLFKKVVIADNCASMVNEIFANSEGYPGSMLFIGAVLFAFQIYCDFSGYSDIAIGLARLFGFRLMKNFAFPYFSRDIAEFWRRWHISLSTWFRDYLYIPLGGSRVGKLKVIRNTFVIFLVSGFWHGANWTFIIWGAVNAALFLPLSLLKANRKNLDVVASGKLLPSFRELLQMTLTFVLVCIAWIFFRSEDIFSALDYLLGIANVSIIEIPAFEFDQLITLVLLSGFVVFEWLNRHKAHALEMLKPVKSWLSWSFYLFLLLTILIFAGDTQEFIYFAF